jgi:coenzyme Q-binding protein COQ10
MDRAMLTQSVERLLPYGRARLFDLAADVERYPEFLRWWISARIWRRRTDVYYTDQVVAFGPLRVGFRSKTILRRPARIEVVSDEPPFSGFGEREFLHSQGHKLTHVARPCPRFFPV